MKHVAVALLLLAACTPKIEFVRIPAGEFLMGEPGMQHRVTISKPFEMSATEVTQHQWQAVMGANPSAFPNPDAPVERVTWNEVQEFLRRTKTRLPTEAEWEYACRAGTTTAYSTGDTLPSTAANYDRKSTTNVASFAPNAWGLYDMHGNVWEWCVDEHCPYPRDAVRDPFQRCGSPYKVIRGGSWHFGADSARSDLRYTHEPHLRGFSIGFRVVRDVR